MSAERFEALRKSITNYYVKHASPELCAILEELRQLAELAFDQADDISRNRLPPLERGAAHLKGED